MLPVPVHFSKGNYATEGVTLFLLDVWVSKESFCVLGIFNSAEDAQSAPRITEHIFKTLSLLWRGHFTIVEEGHQEPGSYMASRKEADETKETNICWLLTCIILLHFPSDSSYMWVQLTHGICLMVSNRTGI